MAEANPSRQATAWTTSSPPSPNPPRHREDCRTLVKIMEQITGAKPDRMWGPSIVGFGTYSYVYATGRSGDWPLTAFSPRKAAVTLYIMCGFAAQSELMDKLGPHKTGKCCLYVKRLSDIHLPLSKSSSSSAPRNRAAWATPLRQRPNRRKSRSNLRPRRPRRPNEIKSANLKLPSPFVAFQRETHERLQSA